MRSKIKYILYICFFIIFSLQKTSLSNEIQFEANTIDTTNENIIIASGDLKIVNSMGQEIFADKLELDNKNKIHKVSGNIYYEDKSQNKIYSDFLTIDENKQIYIFKNNIVLENNIKKIKLDSNKIIYKQPDNIITSIGKTKIKKDDNYIINTSDITFDKNKNFLFSNNKSIIIDNYNNIINLEKFKFHLNKNQLYGHEAEIKDKELNIYKLEKIYYDLTEQKIYGKDIVINEDNDLLVEKNHLARSKSRSLIYNKNNLILNKTVYTNCKKRDNGCPPWLIQAEEINHDKKNKIVNYKNAILKLYDVPVMYFPKFFHPDPTVKRQSGFLTPVLSAQKSNGYLKLPYFFALSESSDFTFSPRLYNDSKNLYQGEYRKVTKNSSHTLDVSVRNDNPFLADDKTTDTHFFSSSKIKSDFNFFDDSEINIKLQSVSNEKYLKQYNVSSPIIESQNTLNSIIKFDGFNDDLEFSISTEVYEDLSKENKNDRYEFILPNFNISKDLNTKLDGQLNLNSLGFNKIYETNINEKIFVNNLTYKSLDFINKSGFINNYELIFKNFNADSKNSNFLKNKSEANIQGLFQFNSKLPMIKENEKKRKILKPIFSVKLNPTNSNKSIRNNETFIDFNNIFSTNRISSNEVLEGGQSMSFGSEYKIFDKLNNLDEVFEFNIAASFRKDENNDLPIKSSLGKKTSNIVGQSKLKINKFIDINYDFLGDNNLGNFNYHKIKSNFRVNNFVTSFEFMEENNDIGTESFISNQTSLALNDNNNLLFRTRKNKKTDLTEYYDLIYQYKMDCLTAGIEYKKSYYSDESIKPEESIFFSITFLPFNNEIDLPGISK